MDLGEHADPAVEIIDIQQHFEKMNHEFPRVEITLDKFGYKIDGKNGIKFYCKLGALRSADYIEDKVEKIAFVEFTDVARQFNRKIEERKVIKGAKFEEPKGKRIGSDLCQSSIDSVQSEIIQKFRDSIHILHKARNVYKGRPASFDLSPQAILVTAPISDEDQPCNREEVSRLLNTLKDKLVLGLPEGLFAKIHVMDIHSYAKT